MEKAGNILAIDDEESFTSFIKLNLQTETRYDVKVTTANSGVEDLKLARTIRPDLILLDIMIRFISKPINTRAFVKEISQYIK